MLRFSGPLLVATQGTSGVTDSRNLQRRAQDVLNGCNLMKVIPIIAGIAGLAMIGALVGYFGAGAVVRSLRAIGWGGFSAICAIHLGVISLEGIAWRLLVPGARVWAFIWARLIRDAGSEVLPVSQMGGCVLGARAVALAGVPGSVAAATTMVVLTLEFVAKLPYMAMALFFLVILRPPMPGRRRG